LGGLDARLRRQANSPPSPAKIKIHSNRNFINCGPIYMPCRIRKGLAQKKTASVMEAVFSLKWI
jgi:hypothetical protein